MDFPARKKSRLVRIPRLAQSPSPVTVRRYAMMSPRSSGESFTDSTAAGILL